MHTGDILQFQTAPMSISSSRSVELKSTAIPGESMPRIVPSSGGPREISFAIEFYQSKDNPNLNSIISSVNWLESLTYSRLISEETSRKQITPVFLVLGNLVELPGYLSEVSVEFGPFRSAALEPILAKVSMKFIEISEPGIYLDSLAARSGQAYRRSWGVSGDYLSPFTYIARPEDALNPLIFSETDVDLETALYDKEIEEEFNEALYVEDVYLPSAWEAIYFESGDVAAIVENEERIPMGLPGD